MQGGQNYIIMSHYLWVIIYDLMKTAFGIEQTLPTDNYGWFQTLILRNTKNQKFQIFHLWFWTTKKISKFLIFRFSKENSLKSAKTSLDKLRTILRRYVRLCPSNSEHDKLKFKNIGYVILVLCYE